MITRWGPAWRAASRFIAGETLAEALKVVGELNSRGILATLDHLGENTTHADAARLAAEEVMTALDAIQAHELRANVSVKLSQIGLAFDEQLCRENIKGILEKALRSENFVCIDMEDSFLTDATIAVYRWARQQGYDNVGIVFQAYLYRTAIDIQSLAEMGVRVRLCKGAYKEPPERAYPRKRDVDSSFDHLTALLFEISESQGMPRLSADGRVPPVPGIATHDAARIEYARRRADSMGLPRDALEFQLLYGIRRDLQSQLVAQGYPVRVYVPYGSHWYPYFMRRLAERPANVWFLLSNFFRA